MPLRRNKSSSKNAFSLVEMLVMLVIMGIMTAVAIPRITVLQQHTNRTVHRENARRVVSICSAARAAGYDFVEGQTDVREVVRAVSAGHHLTEGALAGSFFGLPELNDGLQQALVPYLEIRSSVLVLK